MKSKILSNIFEIKIAVINVSKTNDSNFSIPTRSKQTEENKINTH